MKKNLSLSRKRNEWVKKYEKEWSIILSHRINRLINKFRHGSHRNIKMQFKQSFSSWKKIILQFFFRFHSFKETILHVSIFFKDGDNKFPKLCYKNKKISLKPSRLTEIEQTLFFKMLMHSLPHRTKISTVLGASIQLVSCGLEKWTPLWGTFCSCLSVSPIHHGCYEKELPDECI